MLPSYIRINVTQEFIDYGEAVECELCPVAQDFISAFDQNFTVQPFNFLLSL
jgi:hypothetical protein